MGRIVVVGNEKGGVGKTTIAINLAVEAARNSIDLVLVDADPQQSAARWADRRGDLQSAAPAIPCLSLTTRGAGEFEDLARRYSLVIVDTGAEDSPQLRSAVTVAAAIVIPVQPDLIDLWTLATMESLLVKSRSYNKKLRVHLVVNRMPHQAKTDIGEWIATNVPLLRPRTITGLINRASYGRASGMGLGVSELGRRDHKARSEFNRLYRAIMES